MNIAILFLFALVAAAEASAAAPPGVPAEACDARRKVVLKLALKYGEMRTWRGFADPQLVELFTRKDGKSWSIVVTWPSGVSCLMGAGHASEFYVPPREQPK